MQRFKQIIKWGGIPVGFLLSAAGTYSIARDIMVWGLPTWSWYAVGLVIFTASSLSIIIGFWKENKALKAMLETDDDSNIKLMEWRQEYRKPQSSKVANIPLTLAQMWRLVRDITEEKKKRHIPKEKLLNMVVGLLQIPQDDPILNTSNYTTEDKIKKMTKRLRAKMGFRRPDIKLEAEWRRRLAEEMDKCKIGLQLDKSDEYTVFWKQLNEDRIPITRTKVDHAIDGFVNNLYTLYSTRLFMFYGGTEKKYNIFPREMRDVLKRIEEAVDRAMRGFLVQVNATLEEYSIGKDLNEKE